MFCIVYFTCTYDHRNKTHTVVIDISRRELGTLLTSAVRGAARTRSYTINHCEHYSLAELGRLGCLHAIPVLFLVSIQADHFPHIFSQTITHLIRLETGGVKQGLQGTQSRPPSDGSRHSLGGAKPPPCVELNLLLWSILPAHAWVVGTRLRAPDFR